LPLFVFFSGKGLNLTTRHPVNFPRGYALQIRGDRITGKSFADPIKKKVRAFLYGEY